MITVLMSKTKYKELFMIDRMDDFVSISLFSIDFPWNQMRKIWNYLRFFSVAHFDRFPSAFVFEKRYIFRIILIFLAGFFATFSVEKSFFWWFLMWFLCFDFFLSLRQWYFMRFYFCLRDWNSRKSLAALMLPSWFKAPLRKQEIHFCTVPDHSMSDAVICTHSTEGMKKISVVINTIFFSSVQLCTINWRCAKL